MRPAYAVQRPGIIPQGALATGIGGSADACRPGALGILRAPPFSRVRDGLHRHTRHCTLGDSGRARRARARGPLDRDPGRPDPRRPARRGGTGALLGSRSDRAAVARADAGTRQRARARRHDAAARPRREPAAGAVAARGRVAARAPLVRPRVRARRHGARDRRDAARRHHLLRGHAPLAGRGGAGRRRVPHARQRRPGRDRGGDRMGVHGRRIHRPRHAAARPVPRRPAGQHALRAARAVLGRTTPRSRAYAASRTNWTCRSHCTCTRRPGKSRRANGSSACARSHAWRDSGSRARSSSPCT